MTSIFNAFNLIRQATLLATFIAVASLSYAGRTSSPLSTSQQNDSLVVMHSTLQDMLQQIVDASGCRLDFELQEANVLNIETRIRHKERFILYNPAFITSLTKFSNDRWTVIALLAHEVGHHINGHTKRRGGSAPALELEADEFAGFILHKLGATLSQSQHVMKYIAKTKASRTHPSRDARLMAIEKGWSKLPV